MKYLIISDASSVHVYNFIKNILAGRGHEIHILTHNPRPLPKQYAEYYAQNGVKVYLPGTKGSSGGKIGKLWRLIMRIWFILKIGRCDVCNIHYAASLSCVLYNRFRFLYKKLIISYWGTDILVSHPKETENQRRILRYADVITVTVEHSRQVFVKKFGEQYNDKLLIARFPAGSMSAIEEASHKYTKQYCRSEFGIEDNKVCIVAGYNADPSQHQDIILNQFCQLSKELKEKIHLIIPMQYGRGNQEYIHRVKKIASSCDFPVDILEDYVPFERNAIMYLATDIYLNLRDTDAFSNAMKEQVFSGSTMIQGRWLVYEEMDECKAPVVKINSLDELSNVLSDFLATFEYSDEIKLFYPLYDIFSVAAANKSWDIVFSKIEKN